MMLQFSVAVKYTTPSSFPYLYLNLQALDVISTLTERRDVFVTLFQRCVPIVIHL